MRKNILLLLIFFIPLFAFSQTGTIKGVVKDDAGLPVPVVQVKIQGTTLQTVTDSSGAYEIKNVPYGQVVLIVGDEVNFSVQENVEVKEPDVTLNITAHSTNTEILSAASADIPTLSISDDDVKESSTNNVSSVLSAARDPFNSASSYVFSIARFRIRGYDNDNFPTLMNGVILTDLANNRSEFNVWSGLNDVVRTRESTIGLSPANYSFGGIGGVYSIDSRASQQRKQLQVSYALSDRVYDNRLVITYGSGIGKNGWSYSLSYSRRWANEGYTPGTFYDGHSFFGSLEKKINLKNSLALTVFAAKTKNGRSSPVVQEMYDLAGTNYYNRNWGYQNGKKRNAVVGDNFQPVVILTHDWEINEKSSLETAISFQTGKNKYSVIDWYSAEDPRPDYYRNLPSYSPTGTDPVTAYNDSAQLAAYYMNNPDALQIDWDVIYQANQIHDTALYVISDNVIDGKRYCFNTIYNNDINNNIAFHGGISYQKQDINYYKQIDDMLSGEYFPNLNQFADLTVTSHPDEIYNDLNNPNVLVGLGDKYGFDYVAHIYKSSAWAQSVFKYDHIDFFVAAALTFSGFQRTGNFRNGVFRDNSYGDSKSYSFTDPSFKGGVTYKLNGRNYFYVNGAYVMRAPLFENSFVSPRTRDLVVDDLKSEKISSVEGGYIYRGPRFKARATGYYSQFTDGTDTRSFYYDDLNTFVNYSIAKISKRHMGLEIALDVTLGQGFSATAVAAVGEFIYNDRPELTITQDNKDSILAKDVVVYAENLRVSGGPQSAYTLGLNYRSKKYWYVNVNLNYFDNIYTDYNPIRRTLSSLEQVDEGSAAWEKILGQEKRDGEFTLDASAGWSWKMNEKFKSLKKNSFVVFNLGVTNILDNKEIMITGYEQLRFDKGADVSVFPSKYAYAFGRTFFASITLRFN